MVIKTSVFIRKIILFKEVYKLALPSTLFWTYKCNKTDLAVDILYVIYKRFRDK